MAGNRSRDERNRGLSVCGWIVAVSVAVFLLTAYFYPPRVVQSEPVGDDPNAMTATLHYAVPSPVTTALLFSFITAVQHFEIWRFFTFQFVHANFAHIAGNMVALLSVGPFVEEYLGRRKFIAFYLMCGATGPIGFLLLIATGGAGSPASTLVGASAGVFGVLAAAAIIAPNQYLDLVFPPTPVRVRTMALIMLAVAAYTVFFHGSTPGLNAGGEAAHLGGAVMGWYLIRRPELLDWAEQWPARRSAAT